MNKIQKTIRKYTITLLTLTGLILFLYFFPSYADQTKESLNVQIKNFLLILPPIFVLLGLLDIWVPREIMVKFMGPGSGIKGFLIAFILGSAAAGPLYGAFPIAAAIMKKGAGFFNIIVFIGAWSTTKIPMFLFELHSLGIRFALSRLFINVIGIVIIAGAMNASIPEKTKNCIYKGIGSKD